MSEEKGNDRFAFVPALSNVVNLCVHSGRLFSRVLAIALHIHLRPTNSGSHLAAAAPLAAFEFS